MSIQYTVEKIENGLATVRFSDNSWAEVAVDDTLTEAEFDDLVWSFKPKNNGVTPSFLSVGAQRTADVAPPADAGDTPPDWFTARTEAYGSFESQLEYITENGLAAWQAHVAQIKADNPKPSDD